MPPRFIVAFIVAFWVGSIGYLIYEEYYPWWRTDAPPPFLVELADEAAPLNAHWSIFRGDQKVGSATTVMTCLKDDTVELASTIDNLEFNVDLPPLPHVQVRIVKHHTVQRVTRKGQLRNFYSRAQMSLIAFGHKFDFRATVNGFVSDGKLYAKSSIDSPLGRSDRELEPIPMEMGNALNPMQPIARVPVRPGQHWKISNINPLGEVLNVAIQQLLQQGSNGGNGPMKLTVQTPKALLARVDTEPRDWSYDGKIVSCLVIEYRSDDRDVTGSTWVSTDDGKVMRQEFSSFGDKFVMERED